LEITKERNVAMAKYENVTSYKEATGKIIYGMTNDYMFKIVLESNTEILKSLICALLHLQTADIVSIEVRNPITPGKSVGDKGFILDIKVLLNNKIVINLEMQLKNLGNWIDRSLDYLCRSYDNLLSGQDYSEIMSAVHIGFLDFTLFEDKPEFYATYKMMNVKNFNIYSDKLTLGVVDLSKIILATEEDKAYGIDKWATLFKASTWEELKALAAQNSVFENVAEAMYRYSCDRDVLEECRKIEDGRRYVNYLKESNKNLTAENNSLRASNAEMGNQLADKDNQLADKDNKLAEQAARIAYLEAQLKQN
jgi:predicted transposase/invertase (TIGR01784 family)